jgi:hypothetical protein
LGFDQRFGRGEGFEEAAAYIFLSYIFLFRFCRQKNVGQKNID